MSEEVVTPPAEDPEPEGVVELEVQPGKKERMVPATVLAAERARVRKAAEEKHAKDLEPIKQKAELADRLQADVEAMRPHIEFLRANPHLMQQQQPPEIAGISDEEAERYARDYELYTPTGLDTAKAKRIIARENKRIEERATAAAREAVAPMQQQTAKQLSERNFMWAASQKGADGRPLVDPKILAEEWSALPAEHTADGRVAELMLEKAIGRQFRSGKQPPAAPTHEPTFTEAPGGRPQGYQISPLEQSFAKNVGLSEADWTKTAKQYQPDRTNVLGE